MKRTQAFTLIEVLVVLGLLGLILTSVMNLQTGLMKDSVRVSGQASRLREVQDASGYLADRLRGASAISTSLTVNGAGCSITDATSPCFAVIAREFRNVSSGGTTTAAPTTPNAYLYLAYRLIPRADVPAADRAADSWADTNTKALVEYRQLVCAPSGQPDNLTGVIPACGLTATGTSTIPASVPGTLSDMEMNVVMDRVTLAGATATFTPFTYTPAGRKFELKLRVMDNEQGTLRYTPTGGPLTVVLQHRN